MSPATGAPVEERPERAVARIASSIARCARSCAVLEHSSWLMTHADIMRRGHPVIRGGEDPPRRTPPTPRSSIMSTVLVVDDRPDRRYAMTRVLAAAGFDVRETAAGSEALRLAVADADAARPYRLGHRASGHGRLRGGAPVEVRSGDSVHPVVHKTAVFRDDQYRRRGFAAGAEEY
jgi:CheY-like chemotaxis protein